MRTFFFTILISLLSLSLSFADCNEMATKQISSNGLLTEKDRTRLIIECEEFREFRETIKTDPSGAYILHSGNFECHKREDYIKIYNIILESGGEYNYQVVDSFKSCKVLKRQVLVKIVRENQNDPVVQIHYPDEWLPEYLYTAWVHRNLLKPYGNLLKNKLK